MVFSGLPADFKIFSGEEPRYSTKNFRARHDRIYPALGKAGRWTLCPLKRYLHFELNAPTDAPL